MTWTSPVAVMLVNDQPIVREGLRAILPHPRFEIACECESLEKGLPLVDLYSPDLVLTELSPAISRGLAAIKMLASSPSNSKIAVFSRHDEGVYAERCLRAGAQGFISQSSSPANLLLALDVILKGGNYLSESMRRQVVSRALSKNPNAHRSPVEILSTRELQVLEQLGRGVGTRQIAEMLVLSRKTIETYRENIKVKLNLKNAAQLTQFAVRWELEKSAGLVTA